MDTETKKPKLPIPRMTNTRRIAAYKAQNRGNPLTVAQVRQVRRSDRLDTRDHRKAGRQA